MILELLSKCIEKKASDLHFKTGYQPILRINGAMTALADFPIITADDFNNMLELILDEAQFTTFANNKKLDLGYGFQGNRFRVSIFFDFLGGNAVFRAIPFAKITLEEIGLPLAARKLSEKTSGLVLITGAVGSGKSTTLSAYISHINNNYNKTIITLEKPIEYIFEDNKSLISQRQIGLDCNSFEDGIMSAIESGCDVLMLGELNSAAIIDKALLAAEIGKLVFATLNSNTSVQAIDGLVNAFSKNQQSQTLARLATNLRGIVTQTLIPKKDSIGQIAVFEVLINTSAIKGLINENRINLISSYLESGLNIGMVPLDQSLAELVISKKAELSEVLIKANSPEYIKRKIKEKDKEGN